MKYSFVTADVFTDKPFGGNPLAVFPDARGLDYSRMHAIAREFNLSETVFVFPADLPGNTRALRIFTPGGELPFAGHPTVGCAHALAMLGQIELTGDDTRIVFEELVGPVPVRIRSQNGVPVYCELSVAKLPEIGPPAPSRTTLAEMLSLKPADLQSGAIMPQAISCGVPFLIVPLRNRDALERTSIHLDMWESVLSKFWAADIFVFTRDGEKDGANIRARMFGPSVSVSEDPATGAAVACLGGYLAARDARTDGTLPWTVEQGVEMGRPSLLHVEADKSDGAITAVRVGGASVMMSEGTIEIPESLSDP
jgi:trans-2,3-dihydro-3-hydroxyanthranilate isomerase